MSAAEEKVIGALMLIADASSEPAQAALSALTASSFSDVDMSMAFEAIGRLADRNGHADPFTVDAECRRDDRYRPEISSRLFDVAANTPSSANLTSYVALVREDAAQRFAVSKLNEALATITEQKGNVYERLGRAESVLSAIQDRALFGRCNGLIHAKDVGRQWMLEMTERVEGGGYRGFTLGIKALDSILQPKRVPRGSLVVIGARPKMGKTGILARIVEHFSVERMEAVAMFSLEMPNSQIYERLVVSRSKVDPSVFYRAASSADDWTHVNSAASEFNASKLHIDDTPGIRISHIQREARKLQRKHQVGLIAVDYLTLMEAENAERNDLGYGKITKSLKNLAKELDCVVVLLSQLNRGLESRSDKRPLPSDSRDTGQIEQDCDLWIGLYRDAVYHEDSPEALTEAIVRLNRHGKTGTAYFDLVDGTVRDVDQVWASEVLRRDNQKKTLNYS